MSDIISLFVEIVVTWNSKRLLHFCKYFFRTLYAFSIFSIPINHMKLRTVPARDQKINVDLHRNHVHRS